MAGAGVRVFLPGEVLTATLVNTYLQDQVVAIFDTSNARDAAFGDVGNVINMPELVEGRVCYLRSTNDIQYYSGSAWVSISAGSLVNTITAKGDILVGTTAGAVDNVAVVTNDYILVADSTAPTGVKWSQIALSAIPDGLVTNAKISASALIAHSKLANATAGQVLLGTTTTGVVTATTVSGDVTITGAGVTAISSGVIVDADVSASAAISRGKIADMSIDTKTGNYTLVLTDANKLIEMNLTSTANTVSVPTNASVAFPIGTQINITQYGTGKTQIVAVTSGTTSIRSTPGSYLRDRYSSATLIKRATDEWYLIGDLSAS